jgi:phosphoribosylamine--glycine ligase
VARLLPGTSDSIKAENVRALRQSGLSEREAVLRVGATPAESEETADAAPDVSGDTVAGDPAGRQFVVVTQDGSGLGWAKKLQEEGETVTLVLECGEQEPEDRKQSDQIARGWIDRLSLAEAMASLSTDSTYWIFAENNFPKDADALRARGQKVFGTSALSERLEHDRHYAVEVAESCGLQSPETHECATREDGLAILEAHPDIAYVFKPDDSGGSNYSTFVPVRAEPSDANRETYHYLLHMTEEPGSFILQERIAGTEIDLEVWLYDGEPCMALATLEAKRKNVGDLGEMAGCAGDFVWIVPLDSALLQHVMGPLLPFYKDQGYTGLADANVILTPAGPLFLEVCNRLGYNSHVTLFLGLALDGVGTILADFMDGLIADLPARFSAEIGSSLTVFLDHPRTGLPLHVDPRWEDHFYPFDGYREDDTLLLTGYSSEVGVFVDRGTTVEAAAKSCLDKVRLQEAVSVPDLHYRTDLGGRDYPNACWTRYDALNAQWGHSMRMVGGKNEGR